MEIDTEATATYVRFGRGTVVHPEPYGGAERLVMVDYDKRGCVFGIEFIGRKELNIAEPRYASVCSKVHARSRTLRGSRLAWDGVKKGDSKSMPRPGSFPIGEIQ